MSMRKFWQILCVCLCALVIPACGSDEDDPLPVDEEWRLLNDEAFQKQTQVEGYERLESQSNAGYILYKVLETGDSDEPIYFTSQVECYYKGTFVDGTVFTDMSFEHRAPATINVCESPQREAVYQAVNDDTADATRARKCKPPTIVTSNEKNNAHTGVENSAEKPAAIPETIRILSAPRKGIFLPIPLPSAAPIWIAAPSRPTLAQKRCALHVPAN